MLLHVSPPPVDDSTLSNPIRAECTGRQSSCQVELFDIVEYGSGIESCSTDIKEEQMVGVVVVSHSPEIARGIVDLAGEMAGEEVRLEAVGGDSHGTLGTDEGRVREAIDRANQGDGVAILADLGSAVLTIHHIL